MLINRIIEIGIDIDDPITFFNNTDSNLLKYLKTLYVGKCFKKCLILDVLKIIQYSEPIIDQSQNHCYAKLNIKFEVQGLIYNSGDIITGCKVINIDRTGSMLCEAKNTYLFIKANKYFQSVKVNQIINAVVMDSRYYPNEKRITIMAEHFIPRHTPKTYYYNGELAAEQSEIIDEIFMQINKEENKCAAIKKQNPKGWDYFNTLLYAYKKRDTTTPKNATKIHLLKIKKGWISVDPKLDPTEPYIFHYTDPPKDLIVDPNVSDFSAYIAILYEYLNMRRVLRKMIKIYNTDELLRSHKNIWQIWQNLKV